MRRAFVLAALVACGPVVPPPPSAPPPAPVAPAVPSAPAPAPEPPKPKPKPPLVAEAEEAAQRGADYIVGATMKSGKLRYMMNLDPEVSVPRKYNVLRHAGTLYALAQVQARWPSPGRAAALGRSLRYFRDRYLRPLPDAADQFAAWSHGDEDEAKLGGAGLALVAFTEVRPLPAPTPTLTGLAAFIARMQKDDGSFYSKYFTGKGPDDSWTSLYYPGEAALGLLRLHRAGIEVPGAVAQATRALMYLARSREGDKRVPPDHWSLIATADRLTIGGLDEATASALRVHAGQVIDGMLTDPGVGPDAPQRGGFLHDGRTTPTATRLEGLLAMRPHLKDAARIAAVDAAVAPAIRFLLRSQVEDGPHRGAVPRAIARHPEAPEQFNLRATEVRIDYVQHAISAWLAYAALEAPPS